MMVTHGQLRAMMVMAAAVSALMGCAAKPISRHSAAGLPTGLAERGQLVVLAPDVRIERVEDESPVTAPASVDAHMLQVARESFAARNMNLTECSDVQACTAIAPHSALLARGIVRDEARAPLQGLERTVVLAHSMLAKVGPGWFWDPNSGAIRSGMSSSILRAALIDTDTGAVLWKNEVLLRETLSAQESQMGALRYLYSGSQEAKR